MQLQKFIIIVMLIFTHAIPAGVVLAEKKTTDEKIKAIVAQSGAIIDDDQGVFVVATSRDSQPMFNAMDIIVSFDDIPINSKSQLVSLLNDQFHQSTHKLTVIRDKKLIKLEVAAGPWHVDLHDMTQAAYATLITDQYDQPLTKLERDKKMGMLQQYLKGRPYRTPNNQGPEIDQKSARVSDAKDKKK